MTSIFVFHTMLVNGYQKVAGSQSITKQNIGEKTCFSMVSGKQVNLAQRESLMIL